MNEPKRYASILILRMCVIDADNHDDMGGEYDDGGDDDVYGDGDAID